MIYLVIPLAICSWLYNLFDGTIASKVKDALNKQVSVATVIFQSESLFNFKSETSC